MLQCEALPPSFAGLLTALRPCFTAPSLRTSSALPAGMIAIPPAPHDHRGAHRGRPGRDLAPLPRLRVPRPPPAGRSTGSPSRPTNPDTREARMSGLPPLGFRVSRRPPAGPLPGEEIPRRGPVDPATCVACESHPPDGVPVSRSVKNCGRYGAIAHQGRHGDRPICTPLGGRGDPVLVHLTQRGGRATHPHTTTRSAHSSAASPPGFARVDPPTPPPRNPRHTPELGRSRRPDPQNPETRGGDEGAIELIAHHKSKIASNARRGALLVDGADRGARR